jgi:hypothetical protein
MRLTNVMLSGVLAFLSCVVIVSAGEPLVFDAASKLAISRAKRAEAMRAIGALEPPPGGVYFTSYHGKRIDLGGFLILRQSQYERLCGLLIKAENSVRDIGVQKDVQEMQALRAILEEVTEDPLHGLSPPFTLPMIEAALHRDVQKMNAAYELQFIKRETRPEDQPESSPQEGGKSDKSHVP